MSLINLKNPMLIATEKAAIAAYGWLGRDNKYKADQAAVIAMRKQLNSINFHGTIKIGEGERDNAPMLYIGETVGNINQTIKNSKQIKFDIALDPLEGTSMCAKGEDGSLSVLAIAHQNTILHSPDVYMDKIITSSEIKPDTININNSIASNLKNIAEQKEKHINELNIIILQRSRHSEKIKEIRKLGAKVFLINNGDIEAAIKVITKNADVYIGSGGAPEGVLSAAAIKCLGGNIQGRLLFNNNEEWTRAKDMGIKEKNKIYTAEEMILGDTIFIATAITNAMGMNGININNKWLKIESLIMSTMNQKITNINNTYRIK